MGLYFSPLGPPACPLCGKPGHACKGSGVSSYRFDDPEYPLMALAKGAQPENAGGVMTETIVTSHVWEDDKLAYAAGDNISKEEAKRLGVETTEVSNEVERRQAIARDNARIQEEERAKDAAAAGMSPEEADSLDIPRADTTRRGEVSTKEVRGPKEEGKREQDTPNPATEPVEEDPDGVEPPAKPKRGRGAPKK